MAKQKVIIRVDGNLNIGLGHIYRGIALAEMIEEKFEIQFLTQKGSDTKPINNAGFIYKIINKEIEILEYHADIIVIDSYSKDCSTLDLIRKKGIKLVSIEDNIGNLCFCDLIINHIYKIENKKEYYTDFARVLLLGSKYALLRKSFFQQNINFNQNNPILISLGNSLQTLSIIPRIISSIRSQIGNKNIQVLTSKIISDKLDQSNQNISFFHDLNSVKVKDLINNSSYCFITPGMISYEIFSVNRPVLIGAITPLQQDFCEIFEKNNLSKNMGFWEHDTIEILDTFSEANNTVMMQNQASLFDRKSRARILNTFLNL